MDRKTDKRSDRRTDGQTDRRTNDSYKERKAGLVSSEIGELTCRLASWWAVSKS